MPKKTDAAITETADTLAHLPELIELAPKQRSFVLAVCLGGLSHKDAAIAAGYSASNMNVAGANGSRLAHDPRIVDAITAVTRLLMRADGINSVRKMMALRDNAESETVRFNATKDLLDRAGFNPVQQFEVAHTHELSGAALDAKILMLAAKAGLTEIEAQKLIASPLADAKTPDVIDVDYEDVPPDDDLSDIL